MIAWPQGFAIREAAAHMPEPVEFAQQIGKILLEDTLPSSIAKPCAKQTPPNENGSKLAMDSKRAKGSSMQ